MRRMPEPMERSAVMKNVADLAGRPQCVPPHSSRL
jgi:hypothetical protein